MVKQTVEDPLWQSFLNFIADKEKVTTEDIQKGLGVSFDTAIDLIMWLDAEGGDWEAAAVRED